MVTRIAATMSLIAFAICLVVGGLGADNPFSTTVGRALQAMLATFVLGAVFGAMIKKMLDESIASDLKKISKNTGSTEPKVADK
jgi:hypothetical protein